MNSPMRGLLDYIQETYSCGRSLKPETKCFSGVT